MFLLRGVFSIGISMVAAGCVVPSLQPLVDAQSSVAEPRLLGRWVTSNNPAVYDIRSADDGSYSVTAMAEGGKRAEYRLRCGSIAGHTVIDLFPLDRGGYQSWDFLPLHSAFVLDFTDSGMQLSTLNPGWLDAHTAGQSNLSMPLRISAAVDASVPVFSGPTQELRALYAEQLGNPEAFHDLTSLTRMPELAKLREVAETLLAAEMAYYTKNGRYAANLAELSQPEAYISKELASGVPLPGSHIAMRAGDANEFQLYVLDATGRGYSADQSGVVVNLQEEAARQAARTVASAQYAYYAANGHYAASLEELTSPFRYLDAGTASGHLDNGTTILMASGSGQNFTVFVRLPDGLTYRIDESGELKQAQWAKPPDGTGNRPLQP